jgi:transposase
MEIAKPHRQKRQHSEEFRQAVVQACGEPGASLAGVALANGVNANLVRKWMAKRGVVPVGKSSRREERPAAIPEFVPVRVAPASTPDIRIELCRGNTTVRIEWPAQAAGECGAWLREWLR